MLYLEQMQKLNILILRYRMNNPIASNSERDSDCGGTGPDVGCDGVCFSGLVDDCAGECNGSAVEDCPIW